MCMIALIVVVNDQSKAKAETIEIVSNRQFLIFQSPDDKFYRLDYFLR